MMLKRTLILFGLLLLGGMGASVPVVWAGVITVCPTGCDYDTIQGAVDAAAPGSTIQIASATYTETIIITKTLTLEGVGQPQPVVSGNDVGRPFTILGSVAVTMTNMTVTRGRAPLEPDGTAKGGGIYSQGDLFLDTVTISNNQAVGKDGINSGEDGSAAYGGGVYSECHASGCGNLSIHSSVVISNTARGGDASGTLAWNGGWAYGGGIYLVCDGTSGQYPCGHLILIDAEIAYNTAFGGKGGDRPTGGPSGQGGYALGGGLNTECPGSACLTTQISRTEIHHNIAYAGDGGYTPDIFLGYGPSHGHGGGMFLATDAYIVGSFIYNNVAHSSDFFVLGSPYDWRTSSGGGIYLREATGAVSKSTIWQNEADLGGGIAVKGHNTVAQIDTVTITQNTARECGGGIYFDSDQEIVLNYVTVVENIAEGDPNPRRCGGVYSDGGAGSGIFKAPYQGFNGSIQVKSIILALNTEPNHTGGDCTGVLDSQGFNLINDPTSCTIQGNTNGNILNQNPLLGPLQDNGGLTPTHALLAGSVAIDAAAAADCPATDQRNFARWVDGNGDGIARCDMGAYEYGGAPTDVGLVGTVRGRDVIPLPLALFLLLLSFHAIRVALYKNSDG